MAEAARDQNALAQKALDYQIAEYLFGVGLNPGFPEYSEVDPREQFWDMYRESAQEFARQHFPWEASGPIPPPSLEPFKEILAAATQEELKPLGFTRKGGRNGLPLWVFHSGRRPSIEIEFEKPRLLNAINGWIAFPGTDVKKTLSYWAFFSSASIGLGKHFESGLRHHLCGFHTAFSWVRDELEGLMGS